MSYLPCENPNCKSYGKPHPNCRCHGGLAAGGDVEPYCSSRSSHRRDCKFFKDGGEVNFLDVPSHVDPSESVAGHLMNGGLHGLLKKEAPDQASALDKYNRSVSRGHKDLHAVVNSLFSGEKADEGDHKKDKETIDSWISKGGVTDDIVNEMHKQNSPQAFAKGGDVKAHDGILHQGHLASIYPEHNMMLQDIKGRASNYLSSLRPQEHTPKLAFDDAPDNRKEKKAYDLALHTAAHPLSVLHEIKKGTIEPEHISHLKSLYPEVDEAIQKKLTKRIIEAQLNGEKPSFKVRQGLSLLMGTPLSGELSPQNIMAAQASFQSKKEAAQQGGQPQKKTSAIAKSSQSYLLPNQAAAERQQKQ